MAAIECAESPTPSAPGGLAPTLPVFDPITTPEGAYAAYLDAEWMISTLAYEISDTRDELTKVDTENQGKETSEICSYKEKLAKELQELEAKYEHFFSRFREAEGARVRLGPTEAELTEQKEQAELDAEEEYFDVTESCADW